MISCRKPPDFTPSRSDSPRLPKMTIMGCCGADFPSTMRSWRGSASPPGKNTIGQPRQPDMNGEKRATPSFGEFFRTWLKVGCINFGGPAGQIAMMHRIAVDEKKWIDEERFLHALNFCMLLPGPEATQLATYCGWRLHGTRGGLAAGALFVLPGAVVLWALTWLYAAQGNVAWVAAIFYGLKPAVTAIVAAAV